MRILNLVRNTFVPFFLAAIAGGIAVLVQREPILVTVGVAIIIISSGTNKVLEWLKLPKIPAKYWLFLFGVLGLSFGIWEAEKAQAFFLVRLENNFKDLVNSATSVGGGTGGGNGNGDGNFVTQAISILFTIIRVGAVTLGVGIVLHAWGEHKQRQEWVPIIMPVLYGIMAILAVEVLSFAFLPETRTGGVQ
jgi:uncharacterized membrane protein HdeD (DUF308 family)